MSLATDMLGYTPYYDAIRSAVNLLLLSENHHVVFAASHPSNLFSTNIQHLIIVFNNMKKQGADLSRLNLFFEGLEIETKKVTRDECVVNVGVLFNPSAPLFVKLPPAFALAWFC
jgi:hypothetical protein